MPHIAAIALVTSGLLSVLAIVLFSWSIGMAKALMPLALVAGAIGTLASVLAVVDGPMATWAFLFGGAACGCLLNGARNLVGRPARWIHRFVIYTGYGMTFAAMGAAALWLQTRAASAWLALCVFAAAWILGSIVIFLAKTLTVQRAVKTMPEYHAALTQGQGGQNYW